MIGRGSGGRHPPGRRHGLLATGALSLGASVIGALLNFGLAIAVGRGFGAADTGVFFAVIGLFLVLGNSLKMGADTGSVRSLSRLVALGDRSAIWPTVLVAVLPVAAIGTVGGVGLYAGAARLAVLTRADDQLAAAELLRTLAPFVPLFSLLVVVMAATRGLGGVAPFALVQNILLPLLRVVGVLSAAWLGSTVLGAARGWALGLPVLLALGLVILARRIRAQAGPDLALLRLGRGSGLRTSGIEFWRFALPRAGTAVIEISIEWLDVILVSLLAGPVAAGVYALAARCIKVPMIADQAMRITVASRLSAAIALKRHEDVQAIYELVTRLMILMVWPFLVVVALFPEPIMGVFGGDFVQGAALLLVMALGMLVFSSAGSLQSILLLGGLSSAQLGNKVVSLVIGIGVNVAITPRLGALGGAIAWTVMISCDTALAAWRVRSRMGVVVSLRPVLAVGPIVLVCAGVPALLLRMVAGASLPVGLAAGVVGYAVLAAVLHRTGKLRELRRLAQ